MAYGVIRLAVHQGVPVITDEAGVEIQRTGSLEIADDLALFIVVKRTAIHAVIKAGLHIRPDLRHQTTLPTHLIHIGQRHRPVFARVLGHDTPTGAGSCIHPFTKAEMLFLIGFGHFALIVHHPAFDAVGISQLDQVTRGRIAQ